MRPTQVTEPTEANCSGWEICLQSQLIATFKWKYTIRGLEVFYGFLVNVLRRSE